MKHLKERLPVCLLALLAALPLPVASQPLSDDAHPFRIKRPAAVDTESQADSQSDNFIQGGVTRVGIVGTQQAESTGESPLTGALRQVLLSGQAKGLLDTLPIFGGAGGSNAPPAVYRGWLEKTHPQFSLSTSSLAINRLVVVYGKYDDTGRTLSSLGLRFKTINTGDLDTYDLSNTQALVIDCPGGLSLQAMQKVRDFVAGGGYLFTTDWLLDRLDAQIFPGYITWNGAMNSQKMYDAMTVGQDPVLFNNTVASAHWKMDIHCHVIRVLNKQAVRVLAVSRQLMLDDPDHLGALAVVFPFGRGYVMHMIAHFDRSQGMGYFLPDPAPGIGISLRQAIAINFIVAGLNGTRL